MIRENAVILACTSMLLHLEAAQRKMGTTFPVVNLDRRLHAEPAKMRERILEALQALPENIDTVLVSMGFCGGSWDQFSTRQRVVIPKVDDCITLLLHTDDTPHINLKEKGHMYFRDGDEGEFSMQAMKEQLCREYGMEFGTSVFGAWFADYTNADIIDTGIYDCYAEEYVEEAQKNADLIRCSLGFAEGSNRILEKLVSGRWDQQFAVIEPGTVIRMMDYMAEIADK